MSGVVSATSNNARKLKISGNVHRYQWILLLKFEPDPIKFDSFLESLLKEGPILSDSVWGLNKKPSQKNLKV